MVQTTEDIAMIEITKIYFQREKTTKTISTNILEKKCFTSYPKTPLIK